MEATRSARADLARTLADLGLLPRGYASVASAFGAAAGAVKASRAAAEDRDAAARTGAPPPRITDPVAMADAASHSARVVKAALCAGFAPHGLLRVEAPADKYAATIDGAMRVDADPRDLRFRDERGSRIFLHPSSVCFACGRFDSGWLVASGVVVVGKPTARLVSAAPAYAVLLFGGRLDVRHAAGELVMDGWAKFKAPARIAVLVGWIWRG